MPTAVLTLLASRGLDVRIIACERNDPERQFFGRVWTLLRRLTYRWADVVTANSRGALDSLSAFMPSNKLVYVSNPVPSAPRGDAVSIDHPMVLSIGRLHPQKGHDVLLKAFSIFLARHANWRLAIMGEGPAEAGLRALAIELGIANQVDWLGSRPDPYPWLRAARIFALPSRHEGTPNALLEAMSCGLPCIVSDASPGPLELLEDNISGLVVPVEDHAALATAMERLADDARLSWKLGEAARVRVGAHAPDLALQSWEAAIQLACEPLQCLSHSRKFA
jgi:glycosyltransferase involved in cell wall biosynthesis